MNARAWTKATASEAEKVLQAHFGDRLVVNRGNASFSDTECSVKFTFVQKGENGEALSRERSDFIDRAHYHSGIEADDLGKVFTVNRNQYRITGWNTRARKMPIQATRVSDGRGFKFPVETVRRALADTRTTAGG